MKRKVKGALARRSMVGIRDHMRPNDPRETNLNATDAAILACRKGHLPQGAALPYTADRGLLRRAMMTGIQDSVHFGEQFDWYELKDGDVKVFFVDGSIEQGTFLVGADGSRSAVRKQFLLDFRFLDTERLLYLRQKLPRFGLESTFPSEAPKVDYGGQGRVSHNPIDDIRCLFVNYYSNRAC